MSQHLNFPAETPPLWMALPHDTPGTLATPRAPRRRVTHGPTSHMTSHMTPHMTPRTPTRRAVRPLATLAMTLAVGLLTAVANPVGARGSELAPELRRLATCEDSWYDSRRDEARMGAFANALRAQFRPQDRSPVWKPIGTVSWLGSEVLEITPQSVGMGLGFAVTLKAPYATARPAYERALGQAMARCETSDGLHSCERSLAEKRTALIMAPQKKPEAGTLVGCYYFYEQ